MDGRFADLLPWYVNGTLGADDSAWVDRYLAEHPAARAELAWHRLVQTSICDSALVVSPSIGLAKAMALTRGDHPAQEDGNGTLR